MHDVLCVPITFGKPYALQSPGKEVFQAMVGRLFIFL